MREAVRQYYYRTREEGQVMGDIGKTIRRRELEPLTTPAPVEEPLPEAEPVPELVPEAVPA